MVMRAIRELLECGHKVQCASSLSLSLWLMKRPPDFTFACPIVAFYLGPSESQRLPARTLWIQSSA